MSEKSENISKNPLIAELVSLGLPPNDFAVFGSGPLFAHGLKNDLRDIDLIVRDKAWEKIQEYGKAEETEKDFGGVVTLFDGQIEAFNGWFPADKWDINELIDSAETIDGIKFVTLENVLKWKKMRNAPKDAEHIRLIEEYLAR